MRKILLLLTLVTYSRIQTVLGQRDASLYLRDLYVTELQDSTFNQVVTSSNSLWIVQFYSHWCGHCKNFAPAWRILAKDVSKWTPIVNVGAFDCAVQSCDQFGIDGTPTVKIFYKGHSTFPIRIPSGTAEMKAKGLKSVVLDYIEQKFPPKDRLHRRTVPPIGSGLMSELTGTSNYAAIVYETSGSKIGMEVILDMNDQMSKLPVYRTKSIRSSQSGRNELIVVNSQGNEVLAELATNQQDRSRFVAKLEELLNPGGTTTLRPFTTTPPQNILTNTIIQGQKDQPVVGSVPDKVYQSDLENAIQYMIKKEIPMEININDKKSQLRSIFRTLVTYTPNLRTDLRNFLTSIMSWLLENQFTIISNKDFKEKVAELDASMKPFLSTSNEYVGCKGSNGTYRGYPCALWTLFHALSVNEMNQNLNPYQYTIPYLSDVVSTMHIYIENFFSCTGCATNFEAHSSQMGFAPNIGKDAVLWIWNVHNMANRKLAGDMTEDPNFPKIQWPSKQNCPNCRVKNYMYKQQEVNGVIVPVPFHQEQWNMEAVSSYINQIYRAENIVQNVNDANEMEQEILAILRYPSQDYPQHRHQQGQQQQQHHWHWLYLPGPFYYPLGQQQQQHHQHQHPISMSSSVVP